MPWELSSVLSRLRHPVRRHTSPEPPPEPQPDTTSQHPTQPQHTSQPRINQKILQDPSAYLDEGDQGTLPHGLTPSTRRQSADDSSRARAKPERTVYHSEYPEDLNVNIHPRTHSGLITRMSRIAAGGEWSTFGRNRDHRITDASRHSDCASSPNNTKRISHSPSPGEGNQHLRIGSTPSTFTLSRLTNTTRPSTDKHAAYSSPSVGSLRHSPDNHAHSKRSSPTNTISSRHLRTPQRTRSYTDPSHASSVTHFTTPVTRDLGLDSPRTFGYPTPPDNPSSVSFTYSSPPPPMPPLNHPELAAALILRRKSAPADQSASAALRDRSNTLPGRTLRREDLFPSMTLTFGRSLRHHSSFPQTQQVFDSGVPEDQATRPPDSPKGERRARTVSTSARQRRTSADWSSYQATVGVNSYANQAWPAEVSREILRLSLGSGIDLAPGVRSPGSASGSTAKDKKRSRADRLPDQVATTSPSFLPFPHPSRPSEPAPLKESATLADGRQPLPLRPHSLQFDLGARRGSEQVGRSTMADVKRSSSVVESRNGPLQGFDAAKRVSSGLSDPASSSSKAPIAPLSLHSSSTFKHPSVQTLFPDSASSNVPTSVPMLGVPSTPTPAPRQSDKSRGKRKAEDIDLTPPELKKEGQRPTFVLPLPSENRSQRISNSSHAPSSYHRKRARLSTTSPSVTPVQSRAPSLQETPQSGRNHFSSLSSTTGARVGQPPRTPSRAGSTRSRQPQSSVKKHHERHQSMSQVSIPLSALVSPHAPSVSKSTKFHMRDPRKPPKKPNDTDWGLRFATEDEPGSPLHAWCFFLGFLLFPVWWIAALFIRVPETRIVGDVDAEKAVHIDDPQIEHDAKSWRFRCRVMAVVSLLTYIPFIVLIAIFVPR